MTQNTETTLCEELSPNSLSLAGSQLSQQTDLEELFDGQSHTEMLYYAGRYGRISTDRAQELLTLAGESR